MLKLRRFPRFVARHERHPLVSENPHMDTHALVSVCPFGMRD